MSVAKIPVGISLPRTLNQAIELVAARRGSAKVKVITDALRMDPQVVAEEASLIRQAARGTKNGGSR